VLAIALRDKVYDKIINNIKEVITRMAKVIVIASEGDTQISEIVDKVIYIPVVEKMILYPILSVIPLQLFAYHIADQLGRDVDKPRNLAKSVTVE
ncbi:MAG: SIS domain-containing protein, partial [Atribacterota bacterium]|nr:SIS domain-containing protein [Atribacterota bacterium]